MRSDFFDNFTTENKRNLTKNSTYLKKIKNKKKKKITTDLKRNLKKNQK